MFLSAPLCLGRIWNHGIISAISAIFPALLWLVLFDLDHQDPKIMIKCYNEKIRKLTNNYIPALGNVEMESIISRKDQMPKH